MDGSIQAVLHSDTIVWSWPIAIYLFLAGVSAGSVLIAIAVKRYREFNKRTVSSSGIVRAMALIAPLSVILGLGILIIDLTKPWQFWKMMVYWNPSSVMFWGVMILSLYILVLMAYLMALFHAPLMLVARHWPWMQRVLLGIKRAEGGMQNLLLFLAVCVGAYTGFLLSALKGFPLLNNPVLPILFLVSGVSSGAASTILFSLICFKEPAHSQDIEFVHLIEKPVLMTEVFLLVAFFLGLVFAGGASAESAKVALMGEFWSSVFWVLVVFCGMVLPWLLQWTLPSNWTNKPGFVASLCLLSLTGIFALRHFILYAGQMTVA
ncbi:cytochrome c nitrite reductase subunit NrfD [Ferrimonas balearica]|uniref:cytochrome c nitrite reductase subunit NrfD n=1 Tax=Ferrimonas balearica TaxID=44012 RepID=UPI001C98F985|nr:cytochrome c nitrite reductase subunit NrfD [Ferrimonas balearica]MBY5921103.1 cytochrome c nitrite reductase subunit NrfD [Ferrimonas balearica]MBY5996212.1 cytochrome c nitrite reductase subunit NrfD [Ferrimonas balearica]